MHAIANVLPRWFAPISYTRFRGPLLKMQVLAIICGLILSGASVGAGFAMTALHVTHSPRRTNTSLFVAIKPPQALLSVDSQEGTNVHVQDEIDQLKILATASAADNKTMHEEIFNLGKEETGHFNALQSRMDVYDTKFNLIVSIGGGLLTLTTTVIAFITFLEQARNRRRRIARAAGARSQQEDED